MRFAQDMLNSKVIFWITSVISYLVSTFMSPFQYRKCNSVDLKAHSSKFWSSETISLKNETFCLCPTWIHIVPFFGGGGDFCPPPFPFMVATNPLRETWRSCSALQEASSGQSIVKFLFGGPLRGRGRSQGCRAWFHSHPLPKGFLAKRFSQGRGGGRGRGVTRFSNPSPTEQKAESRVCKRRFHKNLILKRNQTQEEQYESKEILTLLLECEVLCEMPTLVVSS